VRRLAWCTHVTKKEKTGVGRKVQGAVGSSGLGCFIQGNFSVLGGARGGESAVTAVIGAAEVSHYSGSAGLVRGIKTTSDAVALSKLFEVLEGVLTPGAPENYGVKWGLGRGRLGVVGVRLHPSYYYSRWGLEEDSDSERRQGQRVGGGIHKTGKKLRLDSAEGKGDADSPELNLPDPKNGKEEKNRKCHC